MDVQDKLETSRPKDVKPAQLELAGQLENTAPNGPVSLPWVRTTSALQRASAQGWRVTHILPAEPPHSSNSDNLFVQRIVPTAMSSRRSLPVTIHNPPSETTPIALKPKFVFPLPASTSHQPKHTILEPTFHLSNHPLLLAPVDSLLS